MKPAAFLPLILLAACARSEPASQSSDANGHVEVEQVRDTGGDEEQTALGAWRMALQGERQALEFGPQGSAALVTIVCGDRNGLVLQRRGALPPGASPTLSVSVGGQGRQLPVAAGTGAVATQNAPIPPGDELIQLISTAQAPISLRFGDSTPLLLPPSPLVGRFAQSCASGGAGRIEGEGIEGGVEGNMAGNASAPLGGNEAAPAPAGNATSPAAAR
jgi:hypothetical protein